MNFSILLVLKNRSNYTVRLMHKWNLEKFPHKIWIADGGNDSHIEALLLNKENFKKRMSAAKKEISHYSEYDFVIINNDLQQAVDQIKLILLSERLRGYRHLNLDKTEEFSLKNLPLLVFLDLLVMD